MCLQTLRRAKNPEHICGQGHGPFIPNTFEPCQQKTQIEGKDTMLLTMRSCFVAYLL